uniref:Uncharacterized protein n=1 Tax=Glossina austeni TaxID=7395 RepID=A0A1A9VHX3_GLOAU
MVIISQRELRVAFLFSFIVVAVNYCVYHAHTPELTIARPFSQLSVVICNLYNSSAGFSGYRFLDIVGFLFSSDRERTQTDGTSTSTADITMTDVAPLYTKETPASKGPHPEHVAAGVSKMNPTVELS